MIKKIIFYLKWGFKTICLRKHIPLNSSIILTDKCNLNCRHCTVANLGYESLSISDVQKDIKTVYALGSRMIVITGGEPMIWNDDLGNTVEDVVDFANSLGFFRTVICTNGTISLESSADYLLVSLDGFEIDHNKIRGTVFSKVLKNITESSHRGIYINFTISSNNWKSFSESAEEILSIKNVNGILFHLFTPYTGCDESLLLEPEQRQNVLQKLLNFKCRHPIKTFNTFAGISELRRDRWERPIWASVTINQGQITECCCRDGIYDESVCRRCGCSPAVETWVLQQLKMTAMIENLRYL